MSKEVNQKYNSYPKEVQKKILSLRTLILKVAQEDKEIDFIGEELKWGEPSFLTKSSGTTLRIDWKEKNPETISLYINCQTKLISIFKEMYPDDFDYIGSREVRLPLKGKLSQSKIKQIVRLTLKYHLIKNLY